MMGGRYPQIMQALKRAGQRNKRRVRRAAFFYEIYRALQAGKCVYGESLQKPLFIRV